MNLRSKLAKLAVVLTLTTGLLAVGTGSASAEAFSTGGTATSTTTWNTGSTQYHEDQASDDIAFNVTSGITIDMRWISCDLSKVGDIRYNITVGEGYRIIGLNGDVPCVRLQWRGTYTTGAFTGTTWWNENIA